MSNTPPRSVLLVRTSAIGDVIMASALIPALRRSWPQTRIGWLVESVAAPLLQADADLHRLHIWPRGRWRKLWKERDRRQVITEFRALVSELRSERYDLAIDLQGLLKSGLWTRLSGAPRRVGLASREGSQWLMTEVLQPARDDPRIGSEYRFAGEALGLDVTDFPMHITVSAQDREKAHEALRRQEVTGPYAVFCPFTTRPQKHWFDERWAELAGPLRERFGLEPVILGGPADRLHAEALRSLGPNPPISLAGETGLAESAALIEGASLLVGVDTGLTHLGSAMNIPTLALFGSTRPYLDAGVPGTQVLYHRLPCSPCRRRPTCDGRFDCMRAHEVSAISERIAEVLGAGS